jgi:hypothetical protein
MLERAAEAARQYSIRVREGGRKRFILHKLLQGFVTWLAWSVLMVLFKVYLFSWHEVIFISLITLPFWMLGAYLSGRWRWHYLAEKV